MRGVPKNLNLKPFRWAVVTHLDPPENIFYFNFERPKSLRTRLAGREIQIGVEALWELKDREGSVMVRASPIPDRPKEAAESLVGRTVVGTEVRSPGSFVLTFDNGHRLEVFDTSDKFESFSIPQKGIYV